MEAEIKGSVGGHMKRRFSLELTCTRTYVKDALVFS